MKSRSQPNTTALQLQLAAGDQAALKQLYELYSERLLHFVFAIIHNREQAEEVVADVFIQLWQRRERLAAIDNLTWYLYVSAKNIGLNYLRKNSRQRHLNIDEVTLPYYAIEPVAIDHLATSELLSCINKAINNLPPKCRLIFKLVKEDGLRYQEVAELLNLTAKTVENQMGIALRKMRLAIDFIVPASHIRIRD